MFVTIYFVSQAWDFGGLLYSFCPITRNQYTSLSFAATLEHNNNITLTDDGNDEPSPGKL